MEIVEGKLYFIKDEFIEKYNPKYHLMENKEAGTKRPTYFCFRDKIDKDILWFVPMSSKYDKYLKLYNDIRTKNSSLLYINMAKHSLYQGIANMCNRIHLNSHDF